MLFTEDEREILELAIENPPLAAYIQMTPLQRKNPAPVCTRSKKWLKNHEETEKILALRDNPCISNIARTAHSCSWLVNVDMVKDINNKVIAFTRC